MANRNTMRWDMGGGGITQSVKLLLIANGACYLLSLLAGPAIHSWLGLVPYLAWRKLYLWQFFTYLFLHGGVLHLALNMYALWVFGTEVERLWGSKVFLRYYFVTGVGAGLIHTLVTPFSTVPTIGASGAVVGVLTAFAMLFPDREVTLLLFFILPVRMTARMLALLFAGLSLVSGSLGTQDGVAHFAHLGGMLVGFLYIRFWGRFESIKDRYANWKRRRAMRVVRRNELDKQRVRRRVDEILDKANAVGFDRLTPEEKRSLKKASEKMGREK
jgi:membrane associated rhomboid family serine protease